MKSFYQELSSGLVFLPELGIGRYPVPASRPYDENYFANYQRLADTDMGHALTQSRIELVARHYQGPVLDVGIGAGQFVETRPNTQGYDVNPAGVNWLNERGAFADLYASQQRALTMWDVLEHIDEPEVAVRQATEFVFVSIPMPEWSNMVFLKFNGATFSATAYPKLALVIPSLTLTEARGEFLRIWDDGRGVDSGRALLSTQSDAIRNITGGFKIAGGTGTIDTCSGAFSQDTSNKNTLVSSALAVGSSGLASFNASNVVPTASENRPRNIAFNFLVRAK